MASRVTFGFPETTISGVGAHSVWDFLAQTNTTRFLMCLCEVGRVDIACKATSNRVGNPNIGCLFIDYALDPKATMDICRAAHTVYGVQPKNYDGRGYWSFDSAEELFEKVDQDFDQILASHVKNGCCKFD